MSPTPAAWTTAAAATLRQEQKMTRPSPLQVLDADMPKWAAGGWKPGDAAGILAALEEAGYVVVERAAKPDGWHTYHVCGGRVREIKRITNRSGRFAELMCVVCGDWCEVLVKPESRLTTIAEQSEEVER